MRSLQWTRAAVRMRLLLLCLVLSLLSAVRCQTCRGVNVSFESRPVSPPIPSDFISFSVEVDVILEWTGRSRSQPRAEFTAMMRQLGRPTIRVGGDSTDYSWYNPEHRPYPPYHTRPFRYNISELDILSIVNGVRSYGGQAVIGLNFRDPGNAEWAVQHLQAIDRLVGANDAAILAYEIGNEVDLFPLNGNRPRDWSPADYYEEWEYYRAEMQRAVPHLAMARIEAGAYCCYNQFEDDMRSFVQRDAQLMRTFSIHSYPDSTENSTTLELQLSDAISQQAARLITNGTKSGNLVSLLSAHNISLVVGEGGANSEPGVLGVCDVFAGSALWAIDALLELARVGLSRFHFHSHEMDLRSPVFFANSPPGVGLPGAYPNVRPLWYGLRFVAMLKEGQPAIIERRLLCTEDERIKSWAVQTVDGTLRIAIIHKALQATAAATVHLDLTAVSPLPSTLYAVRLLGAALQKENITLAGQTWTGSKDGLPVGDFVQESIKPLGNGLFDVDVPPISAVLLSSVKLRPFRLTAAMED